VVKKIKPDELFGAKIDEKFRPSASHEVNVLGLTLLGEIDREVQKEAEAWLKTREDIDALLLFTRYSSHRSGFDVHVRDKGSLLSTVLIRELGFRDLCLHSRIQMPRPISLRQVQFLHEGSTF